METTQLVALNDDDVINDAMWAYVRQNYEMLFRMCLKASRGDEDYAHELFSDEVIRMLPGLLSRWDGVRNFSNYASRYFSLHLRKIAARRNMAAAKTRNFSEIETLHEMQLGSQGSYKDAEYYVEVEDTAYSLLMRLDEESRMILALSKMQGYTYRQIAAKIGKSHCYVAKIVNASLALLREEG